MFLEGHFYHILYLLGSTCFLEGIQSLLIRLKLDKEVPLSFDFPLYYLDGLIQHMGFDVI